MARTILWAAIVSLIFACSPTDTPTAEKDAPPAQMSGGLVARWA